MDHNAKRWKVFWQGQIVVQPKTILAIIVHIFKLYILDTRLHTLKLRPGPPLIPEMIQVCD